MALTPRHSTCRLSMAAFAAVGALLVASGCSSPSAASAYSPPADASARRVALTLVAAINNKDSAVLATVTAPSFAQTIEDAWFGTSIAVLDVMDTYTEDSEYHNEARTPGAEYVNVPLLISVAGGDETLPENPFGWSYLLYRTGPDERWLVFDQGQG